MPNRWAISSGNWSNAAIWSGSIIPTASDAVYSNNQSVYVDTNIQVLSLNNSSTTGVTQGGTFYLNNGVRVQANIIGGNAGSYLVTAIGGTAAVTISGSNKAYITGSITTTTGNYNVSVSMSNASSLEITGSFTTGGASLGNMSLISTSTGTLIISGNITPGTTSGLGGGGVWLNAPTTIVVTGSVIGGPSTNSYGIRNDGTGSIFILGNVQGGSGNTAFGIGNASPGNITINGNVTGGSGVTAYGINNTSVNVISITGSVSSGTTTNCYGIVTAAANTLIVSGSVRASGSNAPAIASAVNGIIAVYGPISSSITANGVSSTGTTATNLFTGPFYNTGSWNAVYAYRMQIIGTSSRWTFDTETVSVTKTLYTSNTLPGVPRETDVRRGVTYNFGLTGSLAMPDPTTVKIGVATDNTTGSAILTAEDMFGVAAQTLTDSGSIGTLLTGASTVQTTGATISSFKV